MDRIGKPDSVSGQYPCQRMYQHFANSQVTGDRTGVLSSRASATLPGTDAVVISSAFGLDSASFTLYAELGIDQARIVTVPEPATLSLLALGGLAVIRRRRR